MINNVSYNLLITLFKHIPNGIVKKLGKKYLKLKLKVIWILVGINHIQVFNCMLKIIYQISKVKHIKKTF